MKPKEIFVLGIILILIGYIGLHLMPYDIELNHSHIPSITVEENIITPDADSLTEIKDYSDLKIFPELNLLWMCLLALGLMLTIISVKKIRKI